MTLIEMRKAAAKILHDARAIVDLADNEGRKLTEEETSNYDKAFADYNSAKEDIARREALEAEEKRLESAVPSGLEIGEKKVENDDRAADNEMAAFRNYLATGETRGLESQDPVKGGFLNAPEQFVSMLIRDLDNELFFRQYATSYQVNGSDGIGVPTLDTDYANWTWTSELNTNLSEDAALRIGKRELKPYPVAKLVKISKTLMRKSVMDVDALVRQRLSYRLGNTFENAYLNGTGVSQPLGVFTASANGISTGQDVSTGNSTTAFTVDGLKEAKYSLKSGYWPNARWIMHRDSAKMAAKLKDGNGRYLWEDSVKDGEVPRLLGFPVHMSELAPNTFTTGLYTAILGDFSHYWIIDALSMQMQVLNELYAATNQVGIIGRYEGDGAPVNEKAFVRVTLA